MANATKNQVSNETVSTELPDNPTLKVIEQLAAQAKTSDSTDALKILREKYGLAITVDGELVKVKDSKILSELQSAVEDGEDAGSKIADGARTVGFYAARAVLDAPVKGASKLKSSMRNGRARRESEARRRADIRAAEKAAREAAEKAEPKA